MDICCKLQRICQATAMRCVSALKSLKAVLQAETFEEKLCHAVPLHAIASSKWWLFSWGHSRWYCHPLIILPVDNFWKWTTWQVLTKLQCKLRWVTGLCGSHHQCDPARAMHGPAEFWPSQLRFTCTHFGSFKCLKPFTCLNASGVIGPQECRKLLWENFVLDAARNSVFGCSPYLSIVQWATDLTSEESRTQPARPGPKRCRLWTSVLLGAPSRRILSAGEWNEFCYPKSNRLRRRRELITDVYNLCIHCIRSMSLW